MLVAGHLGADQPDGSADPSPALFDPNYSPTTPPQPFDFTLGTNAFFGNNGLQTVVEGTGLTQCPGGGGGSPPGINIVKSGPYASAANAGTPLVGQAPGSYLADGTQVFYKIVVTNTSGTTPLPLGEVTDFNYYLAANAVPPSGFTYSGSTLAARTTCVAAPATEKCHELPTTSVPSGYNNQLTLAYDPALHGGNTPPAGAAGDPHVHRPLHDTHAHQQVPAGRTGHQLGVGRLRRCGRQQCLRWAQHGQPVHRDAGVRARGAGHPEGGAGAGRRGQPRQHRAQRAARLRRHADQYVGHGHAGHRAPGRYAECAGGFDRLLLLSIVCTVQSGGAKCPTTTVVAGTKVPAVGSPSPLPQPYHIDHEWGFVGNNTFPPNSSVKFTITLQLTNPTRDFNYVANSATFSARTIPTAGRRRAHRRSSPRRARRN